MQRATDWLSDPRTRIVAGWLVAIALAVTAALIVRGSTPTGSFGATDSQTYLSVAQNLTEGRGLTSSFTNEYDGVVPVDAVARSGRQALLLWPPLYPAALAAGTLVGSDPDHTTAPLGALGAAATALMAMRLVQRLTGSVVLSAAIVVLYLANIWSVLLFATVSSEVLYVPLLLAATLALVRALDAPTVWRLAAYAALAAATALTRYTGASLVLAGAVALAIWLPLPARRRWIAVGATTAAATIPLAVWTLWSRAGTSGRNRSIGWYDKGDDVRAFLALPTEWVLPPEDLGGSRGWVLGALLLVAAVVATVGWVTTARRAATDPAPSGFVDAEVRAVRAAGPVLAVVVAHAAFVIGSGFVLDVTLPLDQRMMMPVVALLAGLVVGGIAWPLRRDVSRPSRWIAATVLVALLAAGTTQLWEVSDRYIIGRDLPGVTGPRAPDDTLAAFEVIPDDALVFANAPTAMYAVTRRGSITLPHQSFPMSAAENPDYAAELADLGQLAREREVWFVWYIPTSAITDYMAPEADMLAALPLELVASAPEVRIYRSVPDAAAP